MGMNPYQRENMASVMDLRLKQTAVIKILTVERCSSFHIHTRLKAVYGETCVDVNTVRQWAKSVKESNPSESSIND